MNWTPFDSKRVLCHIPMISPSAVSALISKHSGRFFRLTMSEVIAGRFETGWEISKIVRPS